MASLMFACASKPAMSELPPPAKREPVAFKLSDRRLAYIIEKQNALAESVEKNTITPESAEAARTELENLWQDYIEKNKSDPASLILYGKFLRSDERPDEAYEIFSLADKAAPDTAVVKQQLSACEAEKGEFAKSYSHISEAAKLAPKEYLYRYQLACLLKIAGLKLCAQNILTRPERDKQMLEAFKTASELSPENAELKLRYAEAFFDVQTPGAAEACAAFDAAIAALPMPLEKDSARLGKAKILLGLNKNREALEALKQISSPAFKAQKENAEHFALAKLGQTPANKPVK
ncbi:MAG: hypothetical protein J6P03_07280 [Opitutales bacterium]|nr:hypothetical protein [Opitutales bacterium]